MKKYIRDSKMRSQLKGAAMTIEPVLSIGKNSLTPEFIDAVRENIVKNELIKINILKNCDVPCKPVKKSFGIGDRVRGCPLVLYGFGYILGWFLSLLFLPFHRLALPA